LAADEKESSMADYRFIKPDGSIAYVIGQAVPEYNIDGQVIGYIGTITDITERKKVDEALQNSRESERAALESGKHSGSPIYFTFAPRLTRVCDAKLCSIRSPLLCRMIVARSF
jgi:hypothetical protein